MNFNFANASLAGEMGIPVNEEYDINQVMSVFNNISDAARSRIHELIDDTPVVVIDHMEVPMAAVVVLNNEPHFALNADTFNNLFEGEENAVIEIIAHEACHLQQVRDGRLIIDNTTRTLTWEGKAYDADEIDPYDESYLDLPWEFEAHEAGLKELVKLGRFDSLDEGWATLREAYQNLI